MGAWIATFYLGGDVDVYVDVTDEPVRSIDCVSAIDLDLDVVRFSDGRVLLDDEDEFIEHRELFGYPAEVAMKAEETAAELVDWVRTGAEPFGTTPAAWLARIA